MRVLSSSFGLLGVVHEVVLRVQPLDPGEDRLRGADAQGIQRALRRHRRVARRVAAAHLALQRPDHASSGARSTNLRPSSRSGIWQIKKSVMRNVLPAFGSTVGSVLAAPGVRGAVVSGMQRALRATLDRAARSVVHVFARMDARLAERGLEGRAIPTALWAFPAGRISETARRVFRVLQVLLQAARLSLQCRERREPAASGPGSLFSVSFAGPHVHARALLDRRTRLGRVPDRLQRFRVRRWAACRRSIRSRALKPEHVAKAFGERAKLFRALRAAHRPAQPALQQLLRASPGVSAAPGGPRSAPPGKVCPERAVTESPGSFAMPRAHSPQAAWSPPAL